MENSQEYAIVAEHLSKEYTLYRDQKARMAGFFFGKKGKPFYALKDLSFTVNKGDSVGLIGMNGSGKSTLSNIIAGLSQPTNGIITTRGSSSIIAIASGLNPYLTGMENIELKGLMMGFEKEQIREMTEGVIEFADIGEFIHQPVKSYSSGMKSRLGFAISINIDPDILIIDEALSVGDASFAQKCLTAMNRFREMGKTIVFVSHSSRQVASFCNKVIWLEYGHMRAYGDSQEVVAAYEAFLNDFNKWSKEEKAEYKKRRMAE